MFHVLQAVFHKSLKYPWYWEGASLASTSEFGSCITLDLVGEMSTPPTNPSILVNKCTSIQSGSGDKFPHSSAFHQYCSLSEEGKWFYGTWCSPIPRDSVTVLQSAIFQHFSHNVSSFLISFDIMKSYILIQLFQGREQVMEKRVKNCPLLRL